MKDQAKEYYGNNSKELKTNACCAGGELPVPSISDITDKKNLPGYINSHTLEELWFHTGTICNLNCAFCYEGSKPGDKRIERINFEEAKIYIDEAVELGVKRFSFTGGEPFVNKDMPAILDYALEQRPCMVLTNGTDPLLKQISGISALRKKPNSLSFRISLDWPDKKAHDHGRGTGTFDKALESLKQLNLLGFKISVARHISKNEHTDQIKESFRKIFSDYGLPGNINIIGFPDLLKPGLKPETVMISEDCMIRYHSEESRSEFMCAFSRMVVKQDGKTRVYACTLVDDDKSYDLGKTLKESLEKKITLSHHRCMGCFSAGVSCSEG